MHSLTRPPAVRRTVLGRLAWCGLPLALGAGAALLLLVLAGAPARTASAAAPATAPAAPSTTLTFPGCGTTIQACLNAAGAGDTIVISAGTYITSLTLSKNVSLTGVNSATVILQALANQRVLTVTSLVVNPGVVISGLTLARGHAPGATCPSGCGGAIFLDSGAHPQLTNLILLSNTAGQAGGGLYATSAITLTNVQLISNTAVSGGGGLDDGAAVTLIGGRLLANQCTLSGCQGGGAFTNANATVTGTEFLSNSAHGGGGGLSVQFTTVVNGGLFQDNQCTDAGCPGGGLFAQRVLTLTGTRFLSNTAQGAGGGLRHDSLTGRVANALFAGNTAANGAGALSLKSTGSVAILHTTIANGSGAAIEVLNGSVGVTNSIITSYTIGISRTAGSARESHNMFFAVGIALQGTIIVDGGDVTDSDPQYQDPAAGNYHLRRGSPAQNVGIDAGVATDVDGDTRPASGGFDAGFDEFVNRAPAAGAAIYITAEDTPLHVAAPGLLANGSDFNGDPFTALLASAPATGTLVLSANGAFSYTPPLNFNGPMTWTYALTDGLNSSVPGLVTITITPVNDAPTLTALADLTVTVDTPISPLPFAVGDVEDAAGALTLTATSSNHALLTDDHIGVTGGGANRNLLLFATPGLVGSTLITLTVHDTNGGTALRTFRLTVNGSGFKVYLPLTRRS